jgi:hypothetical protein
MRKEIRYCPKEFQERLSMFGQNPYGENIFKFAWGRTSFIKMGNIWRDRFGNERRGYRLRCQNNQGQYWTLMRWKPPSFYGSPVTYYANTWDPVSKLYMTGEYPWRGRYEPMQPFMERTFVNGELRVEHLPLTHYLIDRIIPMMEAYQRMTPVEQEAARILEEKAQHKREVDEIAERMMEEMPSYIGPVSYSLQGCRTSLLDKKMEAIQKQWNRLTVGGKRPNFQRGFQQGDEPKILRS